MLLGARSVLVLLQEALEARVLDYGAIDKAQEAIRLCAVKELKREPWWQRVDWQKVREWRPW